MIHVYKVGKGVFWWEGFPHIDWQKGTVIGRDSFCLAQCHLTAQTPVPSTQAEDPNLSSVPAEYLDLKAVFSKSCVTTLLPHHSYDCAIDLLPGACPPQGHLYFLSAPERKAMEEYIGQALSAGIVQPSSMPAGTGFFFMTKRDGCLWPCIDYRQLNKITVRNCYPLPMLNSVFDLFQGATIFMKLDLCNTYHWIWIKEGNEWKTTFNTPTEHYEYLLMPFGLINAPAVFLSLISDVLRDMLNKNKHVQHVWRVLQLLIQGYSTVTTPSPLSHHPRCYCSGPRQLRGLLLNFEDDTQRLQFCSHQVPQDCSSWSLIPLRLEVVWYCHSAQHIMARCIPMSINLKS